MAGIYKRALELFRVQHAWLVITAVLADILGAVVGAHAAVFPLQSWEMQAGASVQADGKTISGADFPTPDWYKVQAPCTVLAGLVQNDEYPDLYVGKNLQHVPPARFRGSWWYRANFKLPGSDRNRRVWLTFNGINYRANIWINGTQIADSKSTAGTYRRFEFDVTDQAQFGDKPNVLAVSVEPPGKNDLAITFVDWNPPAPDGNMGLWQDVTVTTTGPIRIENPYVQTDLDVPSLVAAHLHVFADVTNGTDQGMSGVLRGRIGGITFAQPTSLAAHETRTMEFSPELYPELEILHPRVWWPWQLGKQEMYNLELTFTVQAAESDRVTVPFGIRSVTSRLNAQEHRIFTINGVDLLILGAGYTPDLLQRRTLPEHPHWQEDRIRYVRAVNLNTIRLEGKLEDEEFYSLCDRYGVLVMAGWCCCSEWEQWKNWGAQERTIAGESLKYQIRRARAHPAILTWLNGSDNPPPADVERMYLKIESDLHFPCPILSSAQEEATKVSGESGVKMRGPYGWEPPVYWMGDKDAGGAWGFNTEVGPGATPPTLEGFESFLPPDHRWPMDDVWKYHGLNSDKNIEDFNRAMQERYGKANSLSDYSWKAQAQAYETMRAMFEAFSRNKFDASGEIQWMLNNAWPSLFWNLYDYDMRPGGTFFAAKIGSEPVHILYSYDNRSVVATNNLPTAFPGMNASAAVYNLDGAVQFQRTMPCDLPANDKNVLFSLPDLKGLTPTYFVRLTLSDPQGHPVSINSYWLSTTPDVMNWKKQDWWSTAIRSYGDLTGLATLPPVTLTAESGPSKRSGDEQEIPVKVTNRSPAIAMLVRAKLARADSGKEVLPVFWSDNYFMLLPGEARDLNVQFRSADLHGEKAAITAECFNNRR